MIETQCFIAQSSNGVLKYFISLLYGHGHLLICIFISPAQTPSTKYDTTISPESHIDFVGLACHRSGLYVSRMIDQQIISIGILYRQKVITGLSAEETEGNSNPSSADSDNI